MGDLYLNDEWLSTAGKKSRNKTFYKKRPSHILNRKHPFLLSPKTQNIKCPIQTSLIDFFNKSNIASSKMIGQHLSKNEDLFFNNLCSKPSIAIQRPNKVFEQISKEAKDLLIEHTHLYAKNHSTVDSTLNTNFIQKENSTLYANVENISNNVNAKHLHSYDSDKICNRESLQNISINYNISNNIAKDNELTINNEIEISNPEAMNIHEDEYLLISEHRSINEYGSQLNVEECLRFLDQPTQCDNIYMHNTTSIKSGINIPNNVAIKRCINSYDDNAIKNCIDMHGDTQYAIINNTCPLIDYPTINSGHIDIKDNSAITSCVNIPRNNAQGPIDSEYILGDSMLVFNDSCNEIILPECNDSKANKFSTEVINNSIKADKMFYKDNKSINELAYIHQKSDDYFKVYSDNYDSLESQSIDLNPNNLTKIFAQDLDKIYLDIISE